MSAAMNRWNKAICRGKYSDPVIFYAVLRHISSSSCDALLLPRCLLVHHRPCSAAVLPTFNDNQSINNHNNQSPSLRYNVMKATYKHAGWPTTQWTVTTAMDHLTQVSKWRKLVALVVTAELTTTKKREHIRHTDTQTPKPKLKPKLYKS